jgi:hypothetical protein
MDRMTSSNESTATSIFDKSKKTLTNQYVLGTLVVLAVAYVGGLAPKLPAKVMRAMDNIVVKGVMFFIIALGITHNVVVSIIVALVVLAIILAVQVYLKDEKTEHLISNNRLENGPQNNVRPFSNPAPIKVTDKDELIEEQPLGVQWTQTQNEFPDGWSNDWDEYEQPAQYEMNIADSSSHNTGSDVNGQYVSAAMNGVNGVNGVNVEHYGYKNLKEIVPKTKN